MKRNVLKITSVLLCAVMLACALLPAAFAAKKPRYVVLGDSIAYGSGLFNSTEAVYGKIVADTNGYEYENYAVPGHTTQNLLRRLENDKVNNAVKNADIISISIGGNNFLLGDLLGILYDGIVKEDYTRIEKITAAFTEDLDAIVKTIRALNPDTAILLQTIYNPQTGYVSEVYQQGADSLNAAIREYAEKNPGEILVVEVALALTDSDADFAEDRTHPSVVGNEKIAKAVLETLYENGLGTETEPVIRVKGIDARGTAASAILFDLYGRFFHLLAMVRNMVKGLSR